MGLALAIMPKSASDIEVAGVADLVGFLEDFPQQPAPGGRVLVLQHFQQRQNEDEEAPAQVPVPAKPAETAKKPFSHIRGIAIEESGLSVEVTPRETVELIRQRRSAC